jgi:hypothetical protein
LDPLVIFLKFAAGRLEERLDWFPAEKGEKDEGRDDMEEADDEGGALPADLAKVIGEGGFEPTPGKGDRGAKDEGVGEEGGPGTRGAEERLARGMARGFTGLDGEKFAPGLEVLLQASDERGRSVSGRLRPALGAGRGAVRGVWL